MIYDPVKNALVFSTGGVRPFAGKPHAEDKPDTWMLNLDNIGGGWTKKADIPYQANHISFASGVDEQGKPHHYFVGGQESENEKTGSHLNFA